MSSSQFIPVAFDTETSGFNTDAVISVAEFAHSLGESIFLDTSGYDVVDRKALMTHSMRSQLEVVEDKITLLKGAVTRGVNPQRRHYSVLR